jgi:hypothetical protein
MKRLLILLPLLVAAAACDRSAQTETAPSAAPPLAEAVQKYWQAVAMRDWETTYEIDLLNQSAANTEESKKIDDESPSAEKAPEEKSPEEKKEDYIAMKHRALRRMVGHEVLEVTEVEPGVSGTAQLRVLKPISGSGGQALKELTFVEHWTFSDGEWRRRGTQGGKIKKDIVAAKGVRSKRKDEEEERKRAPDTANQPSAPEVPQVESSTDSAGSPAASAEKSGTD